MTKFLAAVNVLVLLGVGFLVYRGVYPPGKQVPASFTVDEAQASKDLVGRAVTLPLGQLWGFNPEQNVKVTFVHKRAVDDAVIVTASLNSVVWFPKEAKKEPPKDDKKPAVKEPSVAVLDGLARLYYENIQGNWYLYHVEGVSLKVTAE